MKEKWVLLMGFERPISATFWLASSLMGFRVYGSVEALGVIIFISTIPYKNNFNQYPFSHFFEALLMK